MNLRTIYRVLPVVLGPFSIAGANFLGALVTIPLLNSFDYGFFAFTLVVIQLSYNICNGLTAIPMATNYEKLVSNISQNSMSVYTIISIIFSIFLSSFIAINAIFLGVEDLDGVAICSLFVALSQFRWYTRNVAYFRHKLYLVVRSDIAYSATLVILVAVLFFFKSVDLFLVGLVYTLATLIGLVAGIGDLRRDVFGDLAISSLAEYSSIWRVSAKWAVADAITMELSTNAHVYLVNYVFGPEGYAPLAVAALFWRPMSTVISSIAQYQRPIFGKLIAEKEILKVKREKLNFALILACALFVNLILIIIYFTWIKKWIPLAHYDVKLVGQAVGLWSLIMLFRAARVPDSVLCQAAGAIRGVAIAGWISGPVSLIGAGFLILILNSAVWSLLGIACGEAILLIGTVYISRLSLRQ